MDYEEFEDLTAELEQLSPNNPFLAQAIDALDMKSLTDHLFQITKTEVERQRRLVIPKFVFVGFYRVDRAYGGPEEGGWWYNCGTLERPFKIVKTKEQARKLARRANHWLWLIQRGRPGPGSVIYGGDHYQVCWFSDEMPEFFPARTPHYE